MIFSVEPHEIENIIISIQAENKSLEFKKELEVNPEFFSCSSFSRYLTCALSTGLLRSYFRD